MIATRLLHDLGQSLWLDNITRDLLDSGTLKRYIDALSVTGLTSNPTIFDHAIKNSTAYDAAIRRHTGEGVTDEAVFFELALEDITRAADLFLPVHEQTNGVDGWVSLEVSPVLAYDTASTIAAARELHARAGRPNVLIKIPGTREGLPAIEEAIFAGIPVNVTLLFSREHYIAAAGAYLRGIERRPRHCARNSVSPSPGEPTRPAANCSVRRAGCTPTMPAPARSACCGRAREPRTLMPLTSSMSRRWPRLSP
jgi:transaldolase